MLRSKDQSLDLRLCDHNQAKLDGIVNEFLNRQIMATLSVREAADGADVVLLVVKPKDIVKTVAQMREVLRPDTLIVSCATGISLATIDKAAGKRGAIARAMPNTSVSVAKGTTGIYLGPNCEPERDEARIKAVFAKLGELKAVASEDALHTVAALSGSGPAFVFVMLEALIDAGVRSGMTRSDAAFFAKGALTGAAALAESSFLPPADLRAQITSPGGTTAEGLYRLEKGGLRATMLEVVEACRTKSQALMAVAESAQ